MLALRHIFFWASLVACVLGGVFYGLFSCGGYVWHRQFIEQTGITLVFLALFWPPKFLIPWWRRLLYPPTMFLLFRLVQGVVFCFYPSLAPTWREVWQALVFGMWEGPC
jgi:hypothetical protein